MRSTAFIMLVAVSSAWAAEAPQARMYEAASMASLPAEFRVEGQGSWSIEGDKLKGAASGAAAESTLWLGDEALQDVVVEADVAFASAKDPSRWFAIVIREGGATAPGVQFTIRQDTKRSNGLEIAAKRPAGQQGWHVLRLSSGDAFFEGGRTCRVRLEAAGPWICGYINDRMAIRSYRGGEFARAGRVGLRVNGATVMIDRVRVAPLTATACGEGGEIRTRPLVVAHRGFSWIAPENTLAAYRLAIEAGADMAECDVYLTKDKVPVLMHDRTLERTTGTKGRLSEMTLEETRRLDAGKWKAPKYAGERIPTLLETLELTRGKLRLVIEIKEEHIAPDVVKAIQAAGVEPQDVMIFSFYDKAVEEIARIEPRLPTTWLVGNPGLDAAAWRAAVTRALEIRASAIGTAVTHVDPGFVRLAHECGLSVFVWTVNDPQDMSFLIKIGVDAIISDRPDMVFDVIRAAGS